jgi:hypothetical protein
VGPDDGRVEDQDVQFGVAEGGHDRVPPTFRGPAVEAPPLAVPVAQLLRQILPGDAGAGDVQDRVNEPAVVLGDPAVLPRLAGEQVSDPVPVSVADRVSVRHERPSVAGKQDR